MALIGAAGFVGAVQIALPVMTHYPDWVARQLSQRLHRPVHFSRISSAWQPSGPLLTLDNLTLGPARQGGVALALPQAALKFDFGAWLRPAHRWITLRLSDLDLRVEHTAAGWQVAGFANSEAASHMALQSLPVDLDLRNVSVEVVDEVHHQRWRLLSPRLRVVNTGNVIRFGARVRQLGTRQEAMVVGRFDPARRNAQLYVSSSALDFAQATRGLDLHGYALQAGAGDIELWGRWRGGVLEGAAARYDVRDLAVSGPDGRRVRVPALAGALRVVREDAGWNVEWGAPPVKHATQPAGGARLHLRRQAGGWRVNAAARDFDVAPWLALVALSPHAPPALAKWVDQASPALRIDALALAWRDRNHFDATARVSGVHVAAAGAIPGLDLQQAVLRADPQAVSVHMPAQAATVALTHVFRKPFVFRRLGGDVVAWREGGQWRVATDSLGFDTGNLAGTAAAQVSLPGAGHRPFVSAYATVRRAKVTDGRLFWPYRSMSPALVAWLDRALAGGDVTGGRVILRGPLDAWPFLNHEGRFQAAGTVAGATFEFDPKWPAARNLDAAVDFVDNRMAIVATHATTLGVQVDHAVATIPDLANGTLGLAIQGKGDAAPLLDYVRRSPAGADALDALRQLSVSGNSQYDVDISMPLHAVETFQLHGQVTLANASVRNPQWNLALDKLNGPLVIEGKGFHANQLAAVFHGAPAKVSIAVAADVADPAHVVEASLDTTTSAQALAQGFPDLAALVAHARGSAPFQVAVNVSAGVGHAPPVAVLTVASSLAGIALDFPAPVGKPAASTLPLQVQLSLPPAGASLGVSLGDVLRIRGRLADAAQAKPMALAVAFGSTPPASVPASGLVVSGHAATLDVSGWIGEALAGSTDSAFPRLTRAEVSADAAKVFGTEVGGLAFKYVAGADADTIQLDGPVVQGRISLPTSKLMARGISANLTRLYWPEVPASATAPDAPPPPPQVTSPIAPSAIPPLHVKVGDLRLGKQHLGATVLESAPTAAGMHIAKFDSKGKDFAVSSSGDWNGSTARSQSRMVVDITSQDFGDTLSAFGFAGLLGGGQDTHVHVDGTWPGSPSAFSLAWMDGTIDLKLGRGRVLSMQPGFGRLLGLLSVQELPRRLALNFHDVFSKGFAFDHASARFVLKDGSAVTRDLAIAAPAAQIAMQGRIGLRAHDYDLTVHMVPHVGVALPVVGAVVGGPVGAAAGLVVQGLIGKKLNHAAGSTYRVTGSWEKPKIVTVDDAPVPAGSTSSAAATAPAVEPAGAATVVAPAAGGTAGH